VFVEQRLKNIIVHETVLSLDVRRNLRGVSADSRNECWIKRVAVG